ncbi:MAG: hypothetical protein ABI647_11930 [Gemmatimonadota bacterium]
MRQPHRITLPGLLAASLIACGPSPTVTANSSDPTPPSAVWLQADVTGSPLVNVMLGGGPFASQLAATDSVRLTARADDPDGGMRSLRLMMRIRQPRLGTAVLAPFQPATATTSSATPGQQVSPSATVSWTVSATTFASGAALGGLEVMAEAENFAGQVSRTPVLSLCVKDVQLRVHAVPLSDDDGSHAPQVTPTQFADAVQRANRVYCGTGIQFRFDSVTDWAAQRSTGMNRDQTIRADGNTLADGLPRRVVMFLRWGGDPASVTGNGNAYPPPGIGTVPLNMVDEDQHYVALPSLYPTTGLSFLTLQNGSFMAHELGHYLGLYHTFPGWGGNTLPVYATDPADASQTDRAIVTYVRANGGTTDAMDGDRVADTPPDPGVLVFQKRGVDPCADHRVNVTASVGGQPFTYTFIPDLANAMSYYDLCDKGPDPLPRDFSPAQVARMHLVLSVPARSSLLLP